MLTPICIIIGAEVTRFKGDEPLAEALRAAAWFVMDELPATTASDFGDAAALMGLHRQGAMNRWNEAKHNLAIAEGRA